MVYEKSICLFTGIKYSGEHLIANILSQNKNIHFRFESEVFSRYIFLLQSVEDKTDNIIKNIFTIGSSEDSKVICDHCYGWSNIQILEKYFEYNDKNPQILAIVNDTVESAAFIVKKYKPENLAYFLKTNNEIQELKLSYSLTKELYNKYRNKVKWIYAHDIVANIKQIIKDIHTYLSLEDFEYDYSCLEFVEETNAKEILGEFYDEFDQETFWDLEKQKSKPVKDLDRQLQLALRGEFDEALKIVKKLEKECPNSNRAAFNRGWFKMNEGKLLEGQRLLDRGRMEGVFGNPLPNTDKPVWDGKSKGKVLYILEGGFGDQIHGLKYADTIKNICGDITISCSNELMEFLFKNGYKNLISNQAIEKTYFEYWMPSMSAVSILGYEYKDISGKSYINRFPKTNKKFRIGLKWSGNPKFEHEQHRKFPSALFFDSVAGLDVEYVSLQRDEEKDKKPEWVKEVPLDTWSDAQEQISQCDLVISSCTSVAHLSAAMGVNTWIIVPILPYYLWALPGEKTPYYDSATLFRQEKYDDWSHPFNAIRERLKNI